MTQDTFANALDEITAHLTTSLNAIRQGGGEADLQGLQRQITDLIALIERHPGIEAAMADLYVAAEALVNDRTAQSQPMARKLRLLADAQRRFFDYLVTARPLERGRRSSWLHRALQFAA